jgi:hypothetical protein
MAKGIPKQLRHATDVTGVTGHTIEKAPRDLTRKGNMLPNLNRAIDMARRFPQNVFLGNWDAFFFFDSDWIFCREFVESAKVLLQIEGGTQVTIFHLDAQPGGERSSFVIDGETTSEAYMSFVGGGQGKLVGCMDLSLRSICLHIRRRRLVHLL